MRADKNSRRSKVASSSSAPAIAKPAGKKSKSTSSGKGKNAADENVLRDQIRALGGDEAEFGLLKDADGDDMETFPEKDITAKAAGEISSFLKTLDFKAASLADPSAVEESPKPAKKVSKPKNASKEAKQPKSGKEKALRAEEAKLPKADPPKPQTEHKKQLAAAKVNIRPNSRWYDSEYANLTAQASSSSPPIDPARLSFLREKAAGLHASLPPPPTTSKSDEMFISNILASGTLSDRLSALTLMAQASPIHNTRALESLKSMASKKGREESLKALRAVVDWWVGGGAPDRKLRYFADQPLSNSDVTDDHLILWYFEDWLKKYFFSILQLLETLSLDQLPYVRMQAMTLIFQLLDAKPEQEQNLLRLLVNKLGDSEKTVASKASYQLLQLLQHHPAMKSVIVRETSSLILRPAAKSSSGPTAPGSSDTNKNQHARYYGIITFNQITLSTNDQPVAAHLVDLYFQLFREILDSGESLPLEAPQDKDDDEADAKKKGKKRARPTDRHDRKGKAKARGGKPKDTTGDEFAEVEDADSKMISAILTGVNRAFPFAKLDDAVFDKHIDTLFRITHTATFNVSIQALVLIQQVITSKKTVADRFYRTLYGSLIDPRLLQSSKQAMYLNLLFKAIKSDPLPNRVSAFVKRTLQALGMHQPPFICGTLYMLGQLFDGTPGLRKMMHESEGKKVQDPAPVEPDGKTYSQEYDARKRDPQYAHAETTCLWELVPLLNHFHPSVSLHAEQILTAAQVTATPDLGLNTLSHFLDRFVYKNPKKPKPRGASAMQPAAATLDGTGVRMIRGVHEFGKAGTVNEEAFWNKRVEEVPVDQLFFHQFFANKLEKQKDRTKKVEKRKKEAQEDTDADDESDEAGDDGDSDEDVEAGEKKTAANADDAEKDEDSDDSEAEIWAAMQRTMPGPDADLDISDDDSDEIPSGLSDLDDSDSDAGSDPGVPMPGGSDSEDMELDLEADGNDPSDSDSALEEDEDDLIALSDEAPDEIPHQSAFEPEDSEAVSGKRKPAEADTQKGGRKKRRLGQLPTFASYEDYAEMIENGPEDDI